MIRIFDKNDAGFGLSNGDAVINPLKAVVRKVDNGDFYLDLSVGLEYAEYMTEGRIVVVPTPQGNQAFRIHNPEKTHKRITTRARHLFYDTENYLIEDSYVDNQNANYAIRHLNSATTPQSPFTVMSDISTINSFRCVRKSLYEAVQTVLERWGGHLVRSNRSIQIRDSIGQDLGVTVRYKKNLKEITYQEDWSSVVTQLMPVGYDGIMLNSLNSSVSPYVTSSTQYSLPYTKTLHFDQSHISQDDYPTELAFQQALIADLRVQAQAYVDEHCVPELNYTLKANIEKLSDIGDTIEVIDERLGINVVTHVIAYNYDCILGKYVQVEFGNFTQKTMNGLASRLKTETTEQVQEASESYLSQFNEKLQEATDSILGMMNDSYVIYDGNQILVVDRLPKEQAVNVIRINSGGIGFSNTGITGTFNSAWLIDGTLDMQQINVINLSADDITTGTLDASLIDVTNLNASNITTGTLTSTAINNGAFTVDKYGAVTAQNLSVTGGNISIIRTSQTNAIVTARYSSTGLLYQTLYITNMTPMSFRTGVVKDNTTTEYTVSEMRTTYSSTTTRYFGQLLLGASTRNASAKTTVQIEGDASNGGGAFSLSAYSNPTVSTIYMYGATGAITCVSLTQTSDINAKTDISDIDQTEAEQFILTLQPKRFKFKNIDGVHHGFIAQDVEQIADDWDIVTDGDNGFKSLAYNEIIADLVATVQAQQKRIEKLEEIVYGRNNNNS